MRPIQRLSPDLNQISQIEQHYEKILFGDLIPVLVI
ncbi:hypothetical protein T02_1326 [Trichinella nativa]|uniref:Uncharacterized protein n=1 Tax=Trichinella nativa TaxID=6335 RepID=A0A0V1KJF5_9BILA|nr:hypothetical protein T02_1326 [Trichinella nativa]